nr:unnamed protein product [Spirometra erinaceieuropaei]
MAVMASREVVQNGAAVKRSARALESSDPNEVPACLKKLVRTIVRSFYSREHSLIMDLLVRNTIMKEDDLCERLRFEKKQLRQYLHTLKTDQFIKSKLQLETDADGKTAKIIHYFIDYKLFVNVVKYRLDQMQRRLDAEQRQTTSRALFKCLSCNSSYTDLEVDRLFDFTVGKLVCVYCRADVQEEEDNAQRSDARALVAKFHQQVREPLDDMLKECDRVHLSSSVLEPEIRALEPLPGVYRTSSTPTNAKTSSSSSAGANLAKNGQSTTSGGETGKREDTKSASGSLSTSSAGGTAADYTVTVNGKQMSYTEVTPAMVRSMTSEERSEYIRVGKRYHSDVVFD